MNETTRNLLSELPRLADRRHAGEFDDSVFAALYFLNWQIATHGKAFASRKRKHDPRPDMAIWLAAMETQEGETLRAQLLDWVGRYQFRGVIANVPVALGQWLRGAWPIVVREGIPGPREVLRMQARGARPVTVLADYPRLRKPVLNKSNAFAFFLHDLEHAYKFFHSTELHAAQSAFFSVLERAIERGAFTPYLDDAGFVAKFHYLMSDMNTHPEHSRQYLRAILVEFYLRQERKTPAQALSPPEERAIADLMCAVEIPAPLAVCA